MGSECVHSGKFDEREMNAGNCGTHTTIRPKQPRSGSFLAHRYRTEVSGCMTLLHDNMRGNTGNTNS
jgi:hypothetical protein